ncbi:MAG: phage antirepressor KilAC domain-containing protein, partial [Ruminiclostridium sp.]|nr:phage antirepressor KilAC domain-containing protein [Ruminiclostridium sp.]
MENKNEIVLFKHEEFGEVRTLMIDGEPWFVGKDVADILKYKNTKDAISVHIDEEDKRIIQRSENTTFEIPPRGLTIINESGLYSLILSSKLPKAKEFKHWVTAEVLPSLRKHGAYFTPEALYKSLCDPKNLIEILQALADEQKRNTDLSLENAYLSVKAKYYDEILNSTNNVPVTQIAKDYGMSAIGFNKMLHEYGIQYPIRNSWVLYAEYANLGYTQSKTYKYAENKAAMHTCWTQKGRLFLYDFLRERGVLPMCEKECCNEA